MILTSLNPGKILVGANLAWVGSGDGNRVLALSTTEVIWYTWNRYQIQNVYHWNRYNVNTSYNGQLEQIADVGTISLSVYNTTATMSGMRHTFAYGFSAYQVSTSTGMITLNSRISASYIFVPSGSNSWREQVTEQPNMYFVSPDSCGTNAESANGTTVYCGRAVATGSGNGYSYETKQYRAQQVTSQGSAAGEVTSTNQFAYPDNGILENYWYVRGATTQQAGTYIDDVRSTNAQAYPNNGVSGGYWYILAS